MKVLGPEVVPESDAVTDMESAGSDELLHCVDRSETIVDQCRDLLEMAVEGSDAEGNEEWFDIDSIEVGSGVRRRVDDGL
ncbi:MAG: hypothetical protein ACRDZR_14860 [Acidimicrobiales bacterium]